MLELLVAFSGSLFAAVLFNVRRKSLVFSGAAGLLGWMGYYFSLQWFGSVILAAFLGALLVGVFSEVMARIVKTPGTVFTVSGIFPLVPGIGAFGTIDAIVKGDLASAGNSAVETAAAAGAIAFGILIVTGAFNLAARRNADGEIVENIEEIS